MKKGASNSRPSSSERNKVAIYQLFSTQTVY